MKTNSKIQKTFDLENDSVSNLFKSAFWPTMISMLIGGTFVVFDTVFVSHGFHEGMIANDGLWYWSGGSYSSLATIGMSYVIPYTLLLVSFALMIGGGLSLKISKAKAQDNQDQTQKLLNSYLPTTIIIGGILTIFLLIFSKFLIWMGTGFQSVLLDNWFNTPLLNSNWDASNSNDVIGHIFSQAGWYLRIQSLGSISYLYMYGAGFLLRNEGKQSVATKISFLALIINIILDFLLIIVFGFNLVGAAIATVIAQSVGAFIFWWYLKYHFVIKVDQLDWKESRLQMKDTMKNGTSFMGIQLLQMILILAFTISIGIIFYNNLIVIGYYTSAFQAYFSVYTLLSLISLGTILSIAPIIVYNANRGNEERTKQAALLAFKVIFISSLVSMFVIILFPVIITILFNTTSDAYTQRIIQIMFLGFFFSNILLFIGAFYQMIGKNRKSYLLIGLRPILLIFFLIVIGFSLELLAPNWLASWKDSLLPWNADVLDIGGNYYSLGLFWALPVADIIVGSYALWSFYKYLKNDSK